jgi:hypothetical protein
MSAAIDGGSDEYALYGIVQDSQKLAENKPSITQRIVKLLTQSQKDSLSNGHS